MHAFRVSAHGGAGLTYSATRRTAFRTPTAGVRLPAGATSWRDDVRAVALVLPEGALFSHHTAAQLLRLPLPEQDARPLHVTVDHPARRGRRAAVRWHVALVEAFSLQGLYVTTPERTWLDLGPHLRLPELVAVADVILRRQGAQELHVPRGVRAAVRLRMARDLADGRSRSPQESILRVHLRLAGLPPPELNRDIISQGEWIGCGDLVWEEYGLYVEYDGEHHGEPRQRHQDAQTRNRLGQLGWTVRVVTARMMRRVDSVVAMLTQDLSAAGWPGPGR